MKLNPNEFYQVGAVLGLATGALLCLRVVKGDLAWLNVLERMTVAILALSFSSQILGGVAQIGQSFSERVERLGDTLALERSVTQAIIDGYEAGVESDSGSAVIGAINAVFRAGVYGVVNTLGNLAFVLTDLILKCARDVFWILVCLAFPIGAGLYAIFPKILTNLFVYSIELSLWPAILSLIKIAVSEVLTKNLSKHDSPGLALLATEAVAIFLMFSVPSVTHKLVSGALSADSGVAGYTLQKARGSLKAIKSVLGAKGVA